MSTAPDRPNRGTLISIQQLRAVAAIAVLVHHARNPRPWLFDPLEKWNFTCGVEVFFVISGFIMYAAARREAPAEFVRRRIIRVAPLYWIATLTFVAYLAVRGLDLPGKAHLALSLLLAPHASPEHPGLVWPVLVPGWTLTYEMFFYGLFAVGLAFRRATAFTTVAIVGLTAAGWLLTPAHPVLATYTAPILLAFLAGLGVARAHARLSFEKLWPMAPLSAAVLLAHASPWWEMPRLGVMAASAGLVAGALALEPWARGRRWPVLETLGDASYAIYLFHTLVLALVMWWGKSLPLHGWPQFLLLMGLGVGASIASGVAIHLWLEKPLTRALLKASKQILSRRGDDGEGGPQGRRRAGAEASAAA